MSGRFAQIDSLSERQLGYWRRALIIAAYLFAHGLMFLNPGLYWDDWVMFQQPVSVFREWMAQSGGTWSPALYALAYSSDRSVWLTRFISGIAILAAMIAFDSILKTVSQIDDSDRFRVVLLAAIFPVYAARVPLIDAAYSLCLFLFMMAWLLVANWVESRRVWPAAASIVLFTVSFYTASLVIFYGLVLAYLVYRLWRRQDGATSFSKRAMSLARQTWIFLALPVVFVAIKLFVLRPGGLYTGYNSFTVRSLAGAAVLSPTIAVWKSMIQPLVLAVVRVGPIALALAVAVAIALLMLSKDGRSEWKNDVAILVVGFVAFCLAVFAYIAAGKMPNLDSGFDSRLQLLVPFGASLVIVFGLKLAFAKMQKGRLLQIGVIALLVSSSMSIDLQREAEYLREMYKMDAVALQIAAHSEFSSGRTFLVHDRAHSLDVEERDFRRFYEYAGLLQRVYGTQTRFAAESSEWRRFGEYERYAKKLGSSSLNASYKLEGYRPSPPQYDVTIERGKLDVGSPVVFVRLLALRILDIDGYRREVVGVVTTSVTPHAAAVR